MEISTYSEYTVKDFLDDDAFISWVTNPDNKKDLFWNQFLAAHPEKQEELNQASRIIKAYRKQDTSFNTQNQASVWNRIEASLQPQIRNQEKVVNLRQLSRIAAILLIATAIAITFWQFNKHVIISTNFGEVRTVILPDSSEVTLNNKSSLSYYSGWRFHAREVWLNGEALFKVKHLNVDTLNIKPSEKFLVHSNGINIEVLGTTFNVKTRHETTDISLINGKIKVDYLNNSSAQNESHIMKPGDYLAFNHKRIVNAEVLKNPAKITLWTSRQLVFNNPDLNKIIATLQDEYGYHVNLSDPAIKNLKIQGEIKVPTVKELLETISTTLHLQITQHNKNITISNKPFFKN